MLPSPCDVQSFITAVEWLNEQKFLDGYRIVPPNFYMVFLGDYTDRGLFGVEVLYTLMQLKLANPDRVFMARNQFILDYTRERSAGVVFTDIKDVKNRDAAAS